MLSELQSLRGQRNGSGVLGKGKTTAIVPVAPDREVPLPELKLGLIRIRQ